MLQTNPMTPTKTPVASGAHSFIKASCPVPLPSSPFTQPSICCPWPLGGEERGRAGCVPSTQTLDVAACKEGVLSKGWGDSKEIKTPSGTADRGPVLRVGGLFSIQSPSSGCAAPSALSPHFRCICHLLGNGGSSSAVSGRPGVHWWDWTCPGGILRLMEASL